MEKTFQKTEKYFILVKSYNLSIDTGAMYMSMLNI